uniref:Uncharacterized protein n=1 Tax=Rhizophora mucronata TaxID=61149 RepID=A0A2P2QQI7_RHIMU
MLAKIPMTTTIYSTGTHHKSEK